jgi:CBS-domain-containing membrane protein
MRTKTSTVADVMTRRVVALHEDAGFKEIISVLRWCRVSAFPVLDRADRVVGVVSECDLLYKQTDPDLPAGAVRLAWRLHEPGKANAVTAGELMTSPAIRIGPDATVQAAARVMQQHHVKRLPVVTGKGSLAGIVSRADLLSVYERPDDDIWRDVVLGPVADLPGIADEQLTVAVRAGVVTMSGPVADRCLALRLLGMVRHVEGVVAVRDRLQYLPEAGLAAEQDG